MKDHVFSEPDKLDMGRGRKHHLTFGHGPHVCIGSQLARAELRIGFEKLLAASRSLRLADVDEPIARLPHFVAYGPRKLMLVFER